MELKLSASIVLCSHSSKLNNRLLNRTTHKGYCYLRKFEITLQKFGLQPHLLSLRWPKKKKGSEKKQKLISKDNYEVLSQNVYFFEA